jgi:hypothetical protein
LMDPPLMDPRVPGGGLEGKALISEVNISSVLNVADVKGLP